MAAGGPLGPVNGQMGAHEVLAARRGKSHYSHGSSPTNEKMVEQIRHSVEIEVL
jgi:hypothetical protein